MGAPLYQLKHNKRTGESRWFMSGDNGATWEMSDPPDSGAPAAPTPEPQPKPAPVASSSTEPEGPTPASTGEQPWYEVLGRGARDTAGMGFADESGGLGAKMYDALHGTSDARAAGQGVDAPVDDNATAYTAERDAQRAADAQALREQPGLYRTGEAIGLVGTAAAPVSKLGKAAPAVLGAVNAVGSSERDDMSGLAGDAATGAALGYGGGRVASAVAERVAPALGRKFGQWSSAARTAANKRYLRAAGAGKGALDRMGDAGVERYAEGGRRLGIGGGFLPKTAETFGDDAQRVANESNAARAALEEALKERGGAPVDADKLARSIKELKSSHAKGGPTGQPLRDEIDKIAEETRGMRQKPISTQVEVDDYVPAETINTEIEPKAKMQRGSSGRFERTSPIPLQVDVDQFAPPITVQTPREIPWSRANKERIDLGNSTNFAPNTPRAAIRPRVYGKMNEALADAANQAEPGVGDKWRQAGEDEHVGLLLNEFARGRENSEAANRILSLSDQGLGTAAAVATGEPVTGVATALANKAARLREHAIAERVLRAKSSAQGSMSRALLDPRARAAAAPTGARASVPLAQRVPMFGAPAPAMADGRNGTVDSFAGLDATPQAAAAKSRGQMLPDAAAQLYDQDPSAFGKYAQQVFEARKQGEGQLGALITRLQDDPEFRSTVLPKLQQMTAAPSAAER